MTRALVGEIVTFIEAYDNGKDNNKDILVDLFQKNLNFNVKYLENEKFYQKKLQKDGSVLLIEVLRRELKSKIG